MEASRIFSICIMFLLVASLFGPGAAPAVAGGGGPTFTVNGLGDAGDSNLGDDICATATGKCTLRAAIQESNVGLDTNTILFNVGTSGIRTISPSTQLPEIINPVFIDATTQPSCWIPCIELNGSLLTSGAINGLNLSAGYSSIKALIITDFYNYGFSSYGIKVSGTNNLIIGNFIGVRPGDAVAHPNGTGIGVAGSNNIIGGTTTDRRNVISGNDQQGIMLAFSGASIVGTNILGNYIGTNAAGTSAMGNGFDGINGQPWASYTQIGGTASGAGNVISGNHWNGINLLGSNNTVQGNYIGTKADGTGAIPNHYNGIQIYSMTSNNWIGGTVSAARNRIANNGEDGVAITSETTGQAAIRRNLIYNNGQQGIDLGMNGVTPNDFLDPDTGPNGLQNFPIIMSATGSTEELIIKLYSKPNTLYLIEYFSSPAGSCDPTGYGEGRKYIGRKNGLTDGTGYVRVRYLSPIGFSAGEVITATATDSAGNTSEFSKCKTAQ